MKPLSVTDRQRLKELALERTATVPIGRVMFCGNRRILGFADIGELGNVFNIPKDTNTLCVSPPDYRTIKEWING